MAKQKINTSQLPTADLWHTIGAAGEPAFQNSWANYDTATYYGASFMKDSEGFVHLRGIIKSGTMPSTAFTLPAGYRPTRVQAWLCNSATNPAIIQVTNVGNIAVLNGGNGFIYLDSIAFKAEA